MAVLLRCPHCEIKFRCEFNEAAGWPDYCPNRKCGVFMGTTRADDDIVMPFIRSARTKANDDVYRQIEAGSERRAEAAGEMLGIDPSETGLKITNLNDRRDAEVMAIAPKNDVQAFIDQNPNVSGFGNQHALQYGQAVQQGPFPNVGAKMRTAIQNNHSNMVAKHAVGLDADTRRPVIPSTDVISERPADQTLQPGYRRRG